MGSPPARDAVLTAYAKSLIRIKARQLARKPGFTRSDEEDLEQELAMFLLAKGHLFDPARASVNTFTDRVIMSKVAMIIRDRRRQKRAGDFTAQSLEETRPRSEDEVGALRDALTEADARRRLGTEASDLERAQRIAAVVEAMRSLPAEDRDICCRLTERPAAAVARDLGISRHQLRKVIERVRLHFEARGLGEP